MTRSRRRIAVSVFVSSLALAAALAIGVSVADDSAPACAVPLSASGQCGVYYHGRFISNEDADRMQLPGGGIAVMKDRAVMFDTEAELNAFQAKRLAQSQRRRVARTAVGGALGHSITVEK